MSCAIFGAAFSQTPESPLDMSVLENINTPAIPAKGKAYVRTAMDQLRRNLVKNGFEVSNEREGEVLKITIPCEVLFSIGAIDLKPSAGDKLRRLGSIVREPEKYKVLVTVHTDDTGDELYADSISAARANAIDDGLWQIAGEKETNVIPYGIGKDEPLKPNNSRANRALNRRVEIYIVPDEGMLLLAGIKKK